MPSKRAALKASPQCVAVFNAGSSSLKFALFDLAQAGEETPPQRRLSGNLSAIGGDAQLQLTTSEAGGGPASAVDAADHQQAMQVVLERLANALDIRAIVAAGHRVVHGGTRFSQPVRLDGEIMQALRDTIPLAPLHMPHNLAAIEALWRLRPALPQVACFDTAFHRSMPAAEQIYALPHELTAAGVRRYGFHGLSYEYIAGALPHHLGPRADGRVIVAHLGHGASLCALRERRSVATSMGFTPLAGIPMATRPGDLDPGVVPWLLREQGYDLAAVDTLLNQRCGLLGLSGISGDMRALVASDEPAASQAVDYFVHHTRRAIGSLAAALGGLDGLVFTAGIGEHSAEIRARLCDGLDWLGVGLDAAANAAGGPRIDNRDGKVGVYVIPTDEEQAIARHTQRIIVHTTRV